MRNNILFNSSFNQRRYDNAIYSCALQQDLDMLPAGDQTEIGEKVSDIVRCWVDKVGCTWLLMEKSDQTLLSVEGSYIQKYFCCSQSLLTYKHKHAHTNISIYIHTHTNITFKHAYLYTAFNTHTYPSSQIHRLMNLLRRMPGNI